MVALLQGFPPECCTGLSRPVRIETMTRSQRTMFRYRCTGLSRPVRIETYIAGANDEKAVTLHRPFEAGED